MLELPEQERDWRFALSEARLRESHLWSHVEQIQRGIPVPPLKLSLQVLLLRRAIHVLYGECSLNPLSADELQLAEEEMKGFKIPSAKEIAEKRRSGKKLKVGDTSAVDRVTSGAASSTGPTESSPKTTIGRKRVREEEDDQLVVRIPLSASSYSDASFLETVGPALLLPEDERRLGAIGLVQAADWEVTRSFQVCPFPDCIPFKVTSYFYICLTLGVFADTDGESPPEESGGCAGAQDDRSHGVQRSVAQGAC